MAGVPVVRCARTVLMTCLHVVGTLLVCAVCSPSVLAQNGQPAVDLLTARPSERLLLESGDELLGRSLSVERGHLQWELRNREVLWIPLEWVVRTDPVTDPASSDVQPITAALQEAVEIPPAPAETTPAESEAAGLPAGPDAGVEETPWLSGIPFASVVQDGYLAAAGGVTSANALANSWTRRITLGGQFNDGNTQTETLNVQFDFENSPPRHLRQFDLSGQMGRNQGRQTTNRWNFNTNFDWPLDDSDKWIAFSTSKNEYDGLANLDYRGTLSAGLGYRFYNEPQKRLIARFGPGYTIEVFSAPDNHRETLDMFGELEMRWPLKKWASMEHKLRVNPSVLDFELVRIVNTSTLLFDLDDQNRWKLRLGFNYTYISEPSPGRLPADYQSTISLMYTRR